MHIMTKTKAEAEAIFALMQEGEDMEELVKKQSRHSGIPGEYGREWKTKNMLPEPLSEIIFSMPLDKPSNVIETKYGFHIIEVLQREPEGSKELLEVSKDIEKELFGEAREKYYIEWLRALRNDYPVNINYALLNTIKTEMEKGRS